MSNLHKAMKPSQRTVPLSLLLTITLSSRIARATCYDTWGTESPDLVPCSSNSSQPTSCCSKGDYCLSNGLCLSTSVNNLMTQQGCTNQQWIKPCNRICRADPRRFSSSETPLDTPVNLDIYLEFQQPAKRDLKSETHHPRTRYTSGTAIS